MSNSDSNPIPFPPLPDETASSTISSIPIRSYSQYNQKSTALHLTNAFITGRLGSGRPEPNPADDSIFLSLLYTFPWTIFLVQSAWSIFITLIAYALAPDGVTNTLSTNFWVSRLFISNSTVYAVGWALFVILGFFIREASNRYWEAILSWTNLSGYLYQIVRHLKQVYPPTTWHTADIERIVSLLVAYPICLKMHLRGEREQEQLERILDPKDVDDILTADLMHVHCMRIVRAYFTAADDESSNLFQHVNVNISPAGKGTRFLLTQLVDQVDICANALLRIASFQPAVSYVNYMHVFLYIWLFFLPLALVRASGWFTIFWTLVISYSVGMLFKIANALNNPFGYDMQDIKLNRLAAETGLQIFNAYARDQMDLDSLIRKEHDTPAWLEEPILSPTDPSEAVATNFSVANLVKRLNLRKYLPNMSIRFDKSVFLCLLAFTGWSAFIFFITWHARDNNGDSNCRWWCVYIPVNPGVLGYLSLGIFLLLAFWMNDAYHRYWRGLQLWQSDIRTHLEHAALQFAIMCKKGTWHHRDRERLFSFLAALPHVAKLHLRESRDTHEMEKILSPQDVIAFNEADDLFQHCMSVIYAYYNSVDMPHLESSNVHESSLGSSVHSLGEALWNIEKAVQECSALNKFPVSPSFTIHLMVFAVFWLALLPLSIVQLSGFLGFIYVIPIGYTIIKLIKIGADLADPFGFDVDDIPLDTFCNENQDRLHELYQDTLHGTATFVHASQYSRQAFHIHAPVDVASVNNEDPRDAQNETIDQGNAEMEDSTDAQTQPEEKEVRRFHGVRTNLRKRRGSTKSDDQTGSTFLRSIRNVLGYFPSVPLPNMIAVVVWTVIATMLSYAFSFSWKDDKREACRSWCSPIDVSSDIITNIGFALFLVLIFRATDAIGRYDDGAIQLLDMKMHLRNLAVGMIQGVQDGLFHETDKERILAHIVQIPLCFRDILLGTDQRLIESNEGFLSDEDRNAFASSRNPMEYLLRTISVYAYVEDSKKREGHPEMSEYRIPGPLRLACMSRLTEIRRIFNSVRGIKRFPVIISYRDHQHLFTALWILLLPLAMAPFTGFFTILWTPLISYGVLSLQEIAIKLVDPFGKDAIDVPVNEMCTDAARTVVEAVNEVQWGCEYHIRPSSLDEVPRPDAGDNGPEAEGGYTILHLDQFESSSTLSEIIPTENRASTESKTKPSIRSHLTRSIPWQILLGVLVWTIVATVVSFFSRDRSRVVRWWHSPFGVDVTGIYFAVFLSLSFYVQAAFERYDMAGQLWASDLKSGCHSLAVQLFTLFPEGTFHEGDQRRVLAHLVAIPLILKNDLRASRDTREIRGLLSQDDITRMEGAENMANHCLDVIRSYYISAVAHKDLFLKDDVIGNRASLFEGRIEKLEKIARSMKFLDSFDISPGFVLVLNTILGIWFLILPFSLTDISGWFTILWVPIIAFGLLGVHKVAGELKAPFGTDLNDLDIDRMANEIVIDILHVRKRYRRGTAKLVHASEAHAYWKDVTEDTSISLDPSFRKEKKKARERISGMYSFGLSSFPFRFMAAVLIWTILCVVAAWLISENFPFSKEVETLCGPWFCSRIAVSHSVQVYIGFAVFLILGFQLHNSHYRYVYALEVWQDGILGTTRLLTNRLFESYQENCFHDEDRERLAAHLAAFAVAVSARVRGEEHADRFREILNEVDTQQLLKSKGSEHYCIDLVQAYMTEADSMKEKKDVTHAVGSNENWMIMLYAQNLREAAKECEKIALVPLPSGYVQHLKIFFGIWIMLLPLGMVEETGWLTILWIVFIAYGVYGLVWWAEELSNPFRVDSSSVPLEELVGKAREIAKNSLVLFNHGVDDLIKDDRAPFPVPRREVWR